MRNREWERFTTLVVIDLNGAEAGVYMVKARLATSQEVLSTVFVKVAN